MAKPRQDPSVVIGQYISSRARDLISQSECLPPASITVEAQKIAMLKRGNFASVAAVDLDFRVNSGAGKSGGQYSFLVKYFVPPEQTSGQYKAFADATRYHCALLGGDDFPRLLTYETIPSKGTFVLMNKIGDKTLEQVATDGQYDPRQLRGTIQAVAAWLSRFQINATRKLDEAIRQGKMDPEMFQCMFGKRDCKDRILEYATALAGKDSPQDLPLELVKPLIQASAPIREVYGIRRDSFRVTHGDPIFSNLVVIGDSRYGFIDAELALGDRLLDLGATLATPNKPLSPRDWDTIVESADATDKRELDAAQEEYGEDLHSVQERLIPELEKYGVRFADSVRPGNSLFHTYGALFFRAARVGAKVLRLQRNPTRYDRALEDDPRLGNVPEDMRQVMSMTLGMMVESPSRFGISRSQYVDQLGALHEILLHHELISSLADVGRPANGRNGGNGNGPNNSPPKDGNYVVNPTGKVTSADHERKLPQALRSDIGREARRDEAATA